MNSLSCKFGSVITGVVLSGAFSSYLHELAHAVVIKTLYEDVDPSIQLKGFFSGGNCQWGGEGRKLSRVGQFLGDNYSKAAISAAGPIATLALGFFSLSAAFKLQNPLSLGLSILGSSNIFHIGFYAYDDLLHHRNGDFSKFSSASGISPQIVLAASYALPLLGIFIGSRAIFKKTDFNVIWV